MASNHTSYTPSSIHSRGGVQSCLNNNNNNIGSSSSNYSFGSSVLPTNLTIPSLGGRRSSFYTSTTTNTSSNNQSTTLSASSVSKPSLSTPQSSLFTGNRRESFGTSSVMRSSVYPALNGGFNTIPSSTNSVNTNSRTPLTQVSNPPNSTNINNINRNSLSGSFSHQNRTKKSSQATPKITPGNGGNYHTLNNSFNMEEIGVSSKNDEIMSDENVIADKSVLTSSQTSRENEELRKENEELKQQIQKLHNDLLQKEKIIIDKDDLIRQKDHSDREFQEYRRWIESMSLKLIEFGVDPNSLKDFPHKQNQSSNVLSLALDDTMRELEGVLGKYSLLYSSSRSMQLED
ncbi:hypothetical protein C9374_009873 [Naegleria lovaniensis]|uniref:Uncharacterized protein n=1 Tax=Naegleria lovaniensis TaxID=51637 RepID=A0AA88GGV9_NAELO|nr:uncharacterized protein C9374_009873 [Naegleria lovaniensis]KAG2375250.1 hypothetical protein C9374_009873 [Naegleria lovaniensis]